MNTVISKCVVDIVARINHDSKCLESKCNDPKIINGVISTGIASYVAFKVLDVPTDRGVIARTYYNTNLEPTVHQIISLINEHVMIDAHKVVDLTFKMWYQRLLLVRGDVTEKYMLDFLEDSPVLSKDEQDACDKRVDLLLKK